MFPTPLLDAKFMPSTSVESLRAATIATVAHAIRCDAAKRLGGAPLAAGAVRQVELGDAIIPFSNYRTGDYDVAEKRADKTLESRLYSSRRGEDIGSLSVIDKAQRDYER